MNRVGGIHVFNATCNLMIMASFLAQKSHLVGAIYNHNIAYEN